MNGREKSDSAEVAVKPANKTGMPAAEQMEPRAGTEGNAIPQSTSRTQGRADASQARDRIRVAARRNKKENPKILHPWPSDRFRVKHPRWEPYAGIPPVRIWCSEASCHSSG
jgi:RNA-directed DNA polymerase